MACNFCPRTKSWARRPEVDLDISLLDRIPFGLTEYTELQLSGEPLLHPALGDIIDKLHSMGVKVGFSTNGKLLLDEYYLATAKKADIVTVNSDRYNGVLLDNFYVQTLGVDFPYLKYDRVFRGTPSCLTPFMHCVIQADGDVVPCCHAHGKTAVFGNLYQDSFTNIWLGDERKNFLRKLWTKEPNGLCEYCEYPNPHLIHQKLLNWRRLYE